MSTPHSTWDTDARTADTQLAWLDAADDAREAYLAWRDGHCATTTEAFTVYRAALDREEAAARAFELALARHV